jgi:hypothetical protein
VSSIRLPFYRTRNFRKKSTETHKGLQAMDEAVSNLSLTCNPADSGSALYLISAPSVEMNMDLVKELGDYLIDIAPDAIIRYGDYPRRQDALRTTVVLSQLKYVQKVKEYYESFAVLCKDNERKQGDIEAKLKELEDASQSVPSLL